MRLRPPRGAHPPARPARLRSPRRRRAPARAGRLAPPAGCAPRSPQLGPPALPASCGSCGLLRRPAAPAGRAPASCLPAPLSAPERALIAPGARPHSPRGSWARCTASGTAVPKPRSGAPAPLPTPWAGRHPWHARGTALAGRRSGSHWPSRRVVSDAPPGGCRSARRTRKPSLHYMLCLSWTARAQAVDKVEGCKPSTGSPTQAVAVVHTRNAAIKAFKTIA